MQRRVTVEVECLLRCESAPVEESSESTNIWQCNDPQRIYECMRPGASIPMGQGGHVPQYLDWGIITNVPQYFYSNISYFLSMQYFLDKLKEFLVFLLFSRLVQGVVGTLQSNQEGHSKVKRKFKFSS